ncbi:RNA polymerase sigma factor [Olleya aquimaris]|uniref:RNA polymerase sigma-70 factor (ECF subfamily) n=1 Tax=Olleya aquimaris TaxID=639310 RepID=A0A327RL89_9FLAO|nr:RNA polymerase sigma factor [Olleya aquimaris]RAJ16303.1 RNA polymerase sigma-70 factor (ECF subfamily) [Olleya aquimaris]
MTLTHYNIEQLVALCLSGNQLAQLEIYNRYYKAMYNTSFRIVNNSFEAEDIMQESFLTAFTKLEKLKEKSTFSAWLKRIVINNSIQAFNKTKKNGEVALNDLLYKIEDQQGIETSTELTSVKAKQILEGLNALKSNYRIALTLNLIEGYDHEEISQIMQISHANCRTTISRAKESLRQKIKQLN